MVLANSVATTMEEEGRLCLRLSPNLRVIAAVRGRLASVCALPSRKGKRHRAELRLDPSLPRLSLSSTQFDVTMNPAMRQPAQRKTASGLGSVRAVRCGRGDARAVAAEARQSEGADW
jgi:hypothetical protein